MQIELKYSKKYMGTWAYYTASYHACIIIFNRDCNDKKVWKYLVSCPAGVFDGKATSLKAAKETVDTILVDLNKKN